MVVLFAVLSWTLLLWFLVGLCHAARVGDCETRPQELVFAGEREPGESVSELESDPAPERVAVAA
jgi:hypothetical protein